MECRYRIFNQADYTGLNFNKSLYTIWRMKSRLLIILSLLVLLGQISSLEHQYHEHDSNEPCELCIIGSHLDHAVGATLPAVSFQSISFSVPLTAYSSLYGSNVYYYPVRGPPKTIAI